MSVTVDADFISRITGAEKTITNSDEPAKGGPTAAAQSHVGQILTGDVISDITAGEKKLTGNDSAVRNGPTSVAQSILSAGSSAIQSTTNNGQLDGRLNSETMNKITERETQISGEDGPVKGGPTAQAQKHAGEPITSEVLHDITEGEKKTTGGERVKGGPTSSAQSELGKSRS